MSKFKIEPKPGSILGSLRSIGYNLKTALSDIIDNSIAAEAKRIEIVNNDFNENIDHLEWMAIIDDGLGMTIEDMIKALTLGGEGIERERNTEDLGRFGLGLKTASFSQCRKLTLISKKEMISSLVFDLDYVDKNGWEVYSLDCPELLIEKIISRVENKDIFDNKSWTVVYWENLDKIQISSTSSFYSELSKVRNHFELIYHKFKNIIDIRLNGTSVNYWNPYAAAISSQTKLFKYNSEGDTYSLKGHVLKHSSEFQNKNEYENQSKIGTFNQNQGFFVYRNNRLIYRGSWLGLFNKEHHYILARVEINLSNRLQSDLAWGVNISKSSVSIPRFAESDIRAECNRIRSEANNTFRFHGGVKRHKIRKENTEKEIQPIWNFESKGVKTGEKNQYKINIKHPLFDEFLKKCSGDKTMQKEFKQILRYIENYLPVDNIFARKANNEVEQSFENDHEIYEKFKGIMEIYKKSMKVETAFNTLINIEPFNSLSFDKERLIELGVDTSNI
ncbi:ATP-binding protein [Winogradskyella ludwigii]|uniref:ATP-binding protein n=1 Tax=Winogradskyella ludwigii TaxID=2686076 RepID=UPI0015CD67CA|nr:ATP-binding protein [Winogradskyella ludwigii]